MRPTIFPLEKTKLSTLFLCLVGMFTFAQSTSLVVIDSEYSKKEEVLSSVSTSKILELDAFSNPWKAIRETIEADKSISTVHLFTGANYNAMRIGGVSYDLKALKGEFELSMMEGLYQGTNLQLLVYNCNLGSSEEGIGLLKEIGQQTYMNVGACTDCTSIFESDFAFDFTTLDQPIANPILQN